MKTIYLESNFRCHATPGEGRVEIETDFFDGKCDAYIEGYRLVPEGSAWTRSDGKVFHGQMVAPWKDYAVLQAYQEQYEVMQAEIAALAEKAEGYDIVTGGAT